MPFLSAAELADYIPETWAQSILREPRSFDAAERAVAQRITAITGVTAPDDAAAAPAWSKGPAAAMILYARLGFLNPTPEQVSWAAGLNGQALDDLQQHQLTAPTGRTSATVDKIGGLIDDL